MKKIFYKVMTQIWDKKFAANISSIKFADIKPSVMKCEKWASVKPDFVCGGVTQRFQKKIIIGTLTEAPFMVKSIF